MKATNVRLALVSFLFYVSAVCAQQPSSPNAQTDRAAGPSTATVQETGPTLLTYNEITQLYQQNTPPVPLRDKLNRLLTTPFVSISHRLIGFARGVDHPTVRSIPLLDKNPEAAFFTTIERFRFADGNAFDFRGEKGRTSNGRTGNLADSNERGEKGFVPTNELGRSFGPVWKYKLDWIFVRPERLTEPHGIKQSYRFAPHFGRMLKELNESISRAYLGPQPNRRGLAAPGTSLANQCDFGTEECAVKPNQRLFNSWLFVFKP